MESGNGSPASEASGLSEELSLQSGAGALDDASSAKAVSSAAKPYKSHKKGGGVVSGGRPRRPPSGYQLYMSDMRPSVSRQHSGVSFGNVTKILGNTWSHHMTDAEKAPYLDRAKEAREEYEAALAEWEEEQRRNPDAAGVLPKRVASVKAEAFMEEHTSGDAHGAGAVDEAGSVSAGRKRRKVAHYAGLGNLDEDENDDVTCKICRVEFSTLEEKREHLLSRAHNEAASETDVARPAREIALTIPIFTDEFVEHCERREKALKELRQESDQLVRNNSVMVEQISKLKESIVLVKGATAKLNDGNVELAKDVEDLKSIITAAFHHVPVQGYPDGPGADEASIDGYLVALATLLESGEVVDPEVRQKASSAATSVEKQWNETVRSTATGSGEAAAAAAH